MRYETNHVCRLSPRGFLAALASAVSVRASAVSPDTAAPGVRFQHKIAYVPGGVGSDGRDAMRVMACRLNVRLNVVSASTGEALSDVNVSVADDRGKPRLRVHTEGPLLHMCLSRGHYQITAAYCDAIQTVSMNVGAQPADAVVRLRTEPGPDEWLLYQRGCPHAGTRPTAQ